MSELANRIAFTLGWTLEQVHSFSLPMLREIVRSVDPKLAHEITQVMQGPGYYMRAR